LALRLLIIQCYACGKYLACKLGQKTRGCPHCGERLRIGRAKVTSQVSSREEARKVILILNQSEARSRGRAT